MVDIQIIILDLFTIESIHKFIRSSLFRSCVLSESLTFKIHCQIFQVIFLA